MHILSLNTAIELHQWDTTHDYLTDNLTGVLEAEVDSDESHGLHPLPTAHSASHGHGHLTILLLLLDMLESVLTMPLVMLTAKN
eukprot:scaffold26204_cov19-Prasinocladus_malaysianus.AAC.1